MRVYARFFGSSEILVNFTFRRKLTLHPKRTTCVACMDHVTYFSEIKLGYNYMIHLK